MIVENLQLINFKNYNNCSFNFHPKLNFIYGDNGNGKTNILEAVSMLAFTKSFLQNSDRDCVTYGNDEMEVRGKFKNMLGSGYELVLKYDKSNQKKTITFNSEPVSRFSQFFGKIPLVVLSPSDIKITTGTPGDRRRNFDILISQISRLYYDDLKTLNRVIKQKNTVLRENQMKRKYSADDIREMLDGWNKVMVRAGVNIILKRLEFVSEFQQYITASFKDILENQYRPQIEYESEILENVDVNNPDLLKIKSNFESCIEKKFELELKRGLCLTGPQRDDYLLKMDKKGNIFDLKTFASQGEHKTFIVALKLSEYIYLRDKLESGPTGEPVLLLDDLFSELDRNRTQKISALLSNLNQVFLTTTDISHLTKLADFYGRDNITVYNIVNGTAEIIQ